MVAATARRAVLPALLALAALLALPNAAGAALQLGLVRRLPRRHAARRLTVPLDRTGVDPGTIDLRIGRAGKPSGPTLMYLSGGPGGAGLSEMLGVVAALPELEEPLPADRLRPARHRALRAAALPARWSRTRTCATRRAAEDCANRLGVARRHYTTPDSVAGHGGDPRRARRREADAVRDLLRHRARDRLRARLPAARRAADPRLGRRPRRPRPVLHRRTSAR